MGKYYNGYSWTERNKILQEEKKLRKQGNLDQLSYIAPGQLCEMCGDPKRSQWHSEDYSTPFQFGPPATYAICATCHLRLHKRFDAPYEWRLYQLHLRSGGMGSEFVSKYSKKQRDSWIAQIKNEETPAVPGIPTRNITGFEWWLNLTLDKDSLRAAWARPRPMRPRPKTALFKAGISHMGSLMRRSLNGLAITIKSLIRPSQFPVLRRNREYKFPVILRQRKMPQAQKPI